MKEPKSLLGRIAVGTAVFGLSGFLALNVKDFLDENQRNNNIMGRAMYVASGEDGILSIEEKVKFIRDLGLEYGVQEGQKLSLDRTGEFVNIYLDSSYVGNVHRSKLERYESGSLNVRDE